MSRLPVQGGESAQASSRLCVKNIPKYVDDSKLRHFFSATGDVTDVKVVRTKDGKSRCFGFVGYKTAEQAAHSLRHFDKSFFDTCRLAVEFAESFKTLDKSLKRPWSKHSEGSSAHDALVKKQKGGGRGREDPGTETNNKKQIRQDVLADKVASNPQLAEFLDLMKARSVTKTYANDEVQPTADVAVRDGVAAHPEEPAVPTSDAASLSDSDDEYVDLQTGAAEAELSDSGADEPRTADVVLSDDMDDMEYLRLKKAQAAKAHAKAQAPDSDHEQDASGSDDDKQASAGDLAQVEVSLSEDAVEEGDTGAATVHNAFSDDPETVIAQTARLFVRNLPFITTDAELLALFEPFGAVTDAHVVADRVSGRSKGFALVHFARAPDAIAAWRALDGSIFQGRLIHVLPGHKAASADETAGKAAAAGGDAGAGFKAQREEARRVDAGNRRAWSTLYMRDDTVAEAVAALLGVSKADLLDPTAGDTAVRLALGETQVLKATKAELAEQGVNVGSLEAAAIASGSAAESVEVPRSSTALIVKNLPYAATEYEVAALFEKAGGATRVVLPSTRALAIVEMPEKQSARKAFKSLAYKRFHHVPLYLEYAPHNVFEPELAAKEKVPVPSSRGAAVEAGKAHAKPSASQGKAAVVLTGLADAEASDEALESVSIFIKNLSFATSEDAVRRHFDRAAAASGGALRAVRLATGKRPDGKVVSKGYAFAEFGDADTARNVLRTLQGVSLDGHKLELQLSMRKPSSDSQKAAKRKAKGSNLSGTKVIVRNLAFEASAKDVRTLMEAFGAVKTCRLPQKFDGSKRGFAFVDFATKGEAQKAVAAVHGTHLYGRRLLLEYAKEEEGLDELRVKAAAALSGEGKESAAKRRRK